MIDLLINTTDTDREFIPFSSTGKNEVILLVNSSGSTSDKVLAKFAELAIMELEKQQDINVQRITLSGGCLDLMEKGT